MVSFLLWYLSITIIGWLTFPLAYRLLPGLPDRGYTFSRSLGWLLWGYIFWLLASLGVLRNETGGLLFALVLLLALGIWAARSAGWTDLLSWLRSRARFVLGVEALFLIAFAGWAAVRAANPDIFGTEKPMELAFINAILHSPTFPPHDPWLSGYAISYYYFGYVLVAMLAKWSGVPGGVAFNLGISLVFALSALGAYGVVFNLLAGWAESRRRTEDEGRTTEDESWPSSFVVRRPSVYALLGPFFVLLVSNLEGFLEVLHARGLLSAAFWKWLDIPDINTPPMAPFSWLPRLFGTGNWWWWRASRVVQDYDLAGNLREIIDEFPFFSYLLADLHPHVLAMPFAFLAMALALNIFWSGAEGRLEVRRRVSVRSLALTGVLLVVAGFALFWSGLSSLSLRPAVLGLASFVSGMILFAGIRPENGREGTSLLDLRDWGHTEIGISLSIGGSTFLLSAVVLGGLAFLNTWDFPFYVALFAGAYALASLPQSSSFILHPFSLIKSFLSMAIALGIAGVLLYLPFYVGFSSQAGGILSNLIYPTRGAQFWVMFAPLLLPLIIYLTYLWKAERASSQFKKGLLIALGLSLGLWALSLLLGWGILSIPSLGDYFMSAVLAAPSRAAVMSAALSRRLSSPGGWITMVALLAVVLTLLIVVVKNEKRKEEEGIGDRGAEEPGSGGAGEQGSKVPIPYPLSPILSSHAFVLLLTLLGVLLALGPEFFYLRDQFGYRINTIFKFYYQSWLLWSMAAAFGTAILLQVLKRIPALLFSTGLVLLLGMAMTYTVFGLWDKTSGFNPPTGWTLDGTAYLARQNPDEMAAVNWLSNAPQGAVAEAVGGSYSAYARISMLSGQPAVLGWPGHELQWRGGGQEIGSRQADIERLYCTRDWAEAQSILKQYDIRYIYIGGLERSTYVPSLAGCPTGLNEAKFSRNLNQVFKQGDSVIYASH
jgi:uncharacterized membrane protein